MNGVFSLAPPTKKQVNPYSKIGFARNPFESQDDDDQAGPFYKGHIQTEIDTIQTWLAESLVGSVQALSIRGTIGVGKTRILKDLRRAIMYAADEQKIHAVLVFLNKTG